MPPPRCCGPISRMALIVPAAPGPTKHKSTFQFCENGAKAVTWEATSKRVTAEFRGNTVTSLLARSDFELEGWALNPAPGLR